MTQFERELQRGITTIVGREVVVTVSDQPGSQKTFLDYGHLGFGNVALKRNSIKGVILSIDIELYGNFPRQKIREKLYAVLITGTGFIPNDSPGTEIRMTISGETDWEYLIAKIHQTIVACSHN